MNAYATSADVFTRRLEEILSDADGELRQAVAYVDRVIIPEVRRESAGALRLERRSGSRKAADAGRARGYEIDSSPKPQPFPGLGCPWSPCP